MLLDTSMAEALRLTRAGDLSGATALLRATLSGAAGSSPPTSNNHAVIDLKPVRVPEKSSVSNAPTTGRFEARRHTGPAGIIDYMVYRPAAAAPGMPLLVMLHGCTQTPEDFARGTAMNRLADELGLLVAYPRQTQAANPQRCWNWFRPGDQARGQGEPALIAGVVLDVVAAERADAGRVYVAGLSAGGAAAAIMADAYPDVFAAVGIHSGLACGSARDLPSALAVMKRGGVRPGGPRITGGRFVPVITFHGDRDGTVHEVNAGDIVKAATLATGMSLTPETEASSAGGRRYTRTLSRDSAGNVMIEQWTIAGAGHAWSGGDPAGSYVDPNGPDASRAMVRFFQRHEMGSTGD